MNTTTSKRTSLRTRIIAATIIGAGILGTTLAVTATAGAATPSGHAAATTGNQATVIDAADPNQLQQAKDAMSLFGAATNKNFVPTADPIYKQTGWENAGDASYTNSGNAIANYSYEEKNVQTSALKIGGSVETSASAGIGIAEATMDLKLSASHEWETGTSDAMDIDVHVEPGKSVMIEKRVSTADYTGTYTFTANNVDYTVKNVTVTAPAAQGSTDPMTAVDYMVVDPTNAQAANALGVPVQGFDASKLSNAQLNTIAHKLGLDKS